MIQKEDAGTINPLRAGDLLNRTIVPVNNSGSDKQNKLTISELW